MNLQFLIVNAAVGYLMKRIVNGPKTQQKLAWGLHFDLQQR